MTAGGCPIINPGHPMTMEREAGGAISRLLIPVIHRVAEQWIPDPTHVNAYLVGATREGTEKYKGGLQVTTKNTIMGL